MELTSKNESPNAISTPIEEVVIKEEIADYVLQDGNFLEREEAMDENDLQYQKKVELTSNKESANEIYPPIEVVLIKEEIADKYMLQEGNFLEGETAMNENDEFSTLEKLENINDNMQYSSSLNEEHHILENFLNRVKKEPELNLITEEIQIKDECLFEATDSNSENISNNKLLNEGTNKPDNFHDELDSEHSTADDDKNTSENFNPIFSEGDKNRRIDQNVNRLRTKRYKCDECPIAFSYPSDLKRHSRIHTGESTIKCNICEITFTTAGSLNIHYRMHTGEKLNECDLCNKKFTRKSQLIVHKRIHNNERPFKCSICQKEFKENGHLTKHMPIHTKEKPFQCQVCQYKCSQANDLKRHMGKHTGEKPFKCELCQYKCAHTSDLKRHMRIHTEEKPFKCELCRYKCAQAVNLKRHMRIHTGEKPFKCNHCKKAYNNSSSLRWHVKNASH